MIPSAMHAEHRRALGRAVALGGLIYPFFFGLDVFAVLTLFPSASLAFMGLTRLAASAVLAVCWVIITNEKVSYRVAQIAHAVGMSTIAIAIAFHCNELSGPACPFIHGLTFVIVVRSAIVPAPIRETFAHGLLCVAL